MPIEYTALALKTTFIVLAWVPHTNGKIRSFGKKWILSNRKPVAGKELLPWAARCERAYNNLKDYYPGYVAAILLLGILDKFDTSTGIAAVTYVVARLIHYVSYGIGNVPFRGISFIIGLICNLFLLIKIFVA